MSDVYYCCHYYQSTCFSNHTNKHLLPQLEQVLSQWAEPEVIHLPLGSAILLPVQREDARRPVIVVSSASSFIRLTFICGAQ